MNHPVDIVNHIRRLHMTLMMICDVTCDVLAAWQLQSGSINANKKNLPVATHRSTAARPDGLVRLSLGVRMSVGPTAIGLQS